MITIDTGSLVRTCRIIAKHLTALADELEHGEPEPAEPAAETAPARQELSCTSASTERLWIPGQQAPASAFGFGR